jgi:predicted aldo/keto reductase-like oxidoreductase
MQYHPFGQTGIEISALGFGAMRLPTATINGQRVYDAQESIRIIHRAFELGVNYVDTAPYYCDGDSEIIVGQALKGWRDRVYLSTKNPVENSSGADWRRRLEKSLTKLSTDWIDFYHMWGIGWKDYEEDINVADGPLAAAFKAKEEGLIKHISFSFHDKPENLIKLVDTGHFESVLCQYILLDRATRRRSPLPCKGLGVVIMGPDEGPPGCPVGGDRAAVAGEAVAAPN